MPRFSRRAPWTFVAALAAISAGCSDSTASHASLNAAVAQQAGEGIESQMETSISALLSDFFTTGPGPVASSVRASAAHYAGISAAALPSLSSTDAACPTQSPAELVDTDQDGVAESATYTFALPACHFDEGNGTSLEFTGSISASDPTTDLADIAYEATLSHLTASVVTPQGSASVGYNGTVGVAVNATSAAQTTNMTFTATATGRPTATFAQNWSATFTPAPGDSLAPQQPLPAGSYSATGSMTFHSGNDSFTFAVTTATPLQYDPSCVGDNDIRSGEVHAAVSGDNGGAFVKVVWNGCDAATVTLVGAR